MVREHRLDVNSQPEWTAVSAGDKLSAFTGAGDVHGTHMAWRVPCFRRRSPDGISANLARPTKWERGFARGLTRWSLKDRVAASKSNRIGLVMVALGAAFLLAATAI